MTPKAKAFHLHFSVIRDITADNEKAKLICFKMINEILESQNIEYLFTREQYLSLECNSDDYYISETFKKYWNQVKQEIELL